MQTMKADMIRLMDVFPSFVMDYHTTQKPADAREGADDRIEAVYEDVFQSSINHDFIEGSPVHPLKLKFTKIPANGSSLGRQTKNIILAPPPASLYLPVRLMRDYILRFGFAVIGEGWNRKGEAITFTIQIEDLGSGIRETVYSKTIIPGNRRPDKRWLMDSVDLTSFRQKALRIEFKTSTSDQTLRGRGAAWVNPVLAAKDGSSRRPNIILISADTLRADHLGCYGYYRESTPSLDRLAGRAFRFENVISQAPYTAPSHMSMLTSLYPSFHKVNKIKEDRLNPEITTLAESLYNSGYRTWAVTGGGQVSSSYGFSEGFESYMEFTSPEDDVRKKVGETIQFMEENRGHPVFIFFHTYKPHAPYRPLPPYDSMFDPDYKGTISGDIPIIEAINKGEIHADQADLNHLEALYDGDIREMDDQLDELFAYLQREGLWEDTIIIFTSDHGEEFGEHGMFGVHSHTLYRELLSVPLIIHYPFINVPDMSIPNLVRSIDIYPTILEMADIKIPDSIQGQSLLPLMKTGRQDTGPGPAFSERIPKDSPWIRSLRTSDYSYIFIENKNSGLDTHLYFDLRRDPMEQTNIELPDARLRTLFSQIFFLIEEGKIPGKAWGEQELDPETLEILRTLGYIK